MKNTIDKSLEILNGLKKKFPNHVLDIRRGDRLFVNDVMIKAILLYPNMRIISIDEEVEFITGLINNDIQTGRIK
jgi:hypothetical protein